MGGSSRGLIVACSLFGISFIKCGLSVEGNDTLPQSNILDATPSLESSITNDTDGSVSTVEPDGATTALDGGTDAALDADADADANAGLTPLELCQRGCAAPGECDALGTCTFRCMNNSCDAINCPPGIPCDVTCLAGGSTGCNGAIHCGNASSCKVTCTAAGGDGCKEAIHCDNAKKCEVTCTGAGGKGCAKEVNCSRPAGSECKVTCNNSGCHDDVICCVNTSCTTNKVPDFAVCF